MTDFICPMHPDIHKSEAGSCPKCGMALEPETGSAPFTTPRYTCPSGSIFHTYSAFARGIDLVNTAHNYLDLTPKGRDECGRSQFWVKRHDEYQK
jgi:predicted dithiol-disulfide oxidoreductase (DUF899 family)